MMPDLVPDLGKSTLARWLLEAIEARGRATPPVLVSTDAVVKSFGAETGLEAYRRHGPLTEPMVFAGSLRGSRRGRRRLRPHYLTPERRAAVAALFPKHRRVAVACAA